jgi:predicted peroxiredoxin
MARIHYLVATGPGDPTRASIPLHLAVNGAREAGMEASVSFAGDAAVLIQDGVAEQVTGIGVPPFKELLAAAVQKGVKLYV